MINRKGMTVMKKPKEMDWMRIGLREKIQPAEQELINQLASEHQLSQDVQDDLSLNRLLRRLPDRPVSSNFTALVLEAATKSQQLQKEPVKKSSWIRRAILSMGAPSGFHGVCWEE